MSAASSSIEKLSDDELKKRLAILEKITSNLIKQQRNIPDKRGGKMNVYLANAIAEAEKEIKAVEIEIAKRKKAK
jgi:hypothetical protein